MESLKNLIILEKEQTVLGDIILQLRDKDLHTDRQKFRSNVRRLGTIVGYEMSRSLSYHKKDITTPLGVAQADVLTQQPVIATILRGGLPFQQGVLDLFDKAECAFVTAFRKHTDDSFVIQLDAVSCPKIDGKDLIIVDTMLATGQSLVSAIRSLMQYGTPRKILVGSVIASVQGAQHVQEHFPDSQIWTVVLDEELNDDQYIVPGIGDAGDLMFGQKEQH